MYILHNMHKMRYKNQLIKDIFVSTFHSKLDTQNTFLTIHFEQYVYLT